MGKGRSVVGEKLTLSLLDTDIRKYVKTGAKQFGPLLFS